jgi:hypothetical protein
MHHESDVVWCVSSANREQCDVGLMGGTIH